MTYHENIDSLLWVSLFLNLLSIPSFDNRIFIFLYTTRSTHLTVSGIFELTLVLETSKCPMLAYQCTTSFLP